MDPQPAAAEPKWFQLDESESQVRAMLGQPAMVVPFGDFRSWQYRFGDELDHDEFSHALVFRNSDGKLISISRTYSPERNVDPFFPPGESKAYLYQREGGMNFSVRVRRLSGGRLLMAMGVAKPGEATGQLLMIRESELRTFYGWLADAIAQ